MKILVIDKSIFRGKLDVSHPLIKHLEFWSSGINQIDLLARFERGVEKKLKTKITVIKPPSKLFFLSLFFTYYYIVFKSKKYDLIIEVWENRPNYKLIYNKRRSLIVIFGNNFGTLIPRKLFLLAYKNNIFLVNSSLVQNKLINYGFNSKAVKYIHDGVANENSQAKNKSIRKKNKISIVCGKNVDAVISLIGLIERRSLDWKFVVLSDKKIIMKLKKIYNGSSLASSVKVVVNTDSSFDMNVANSKFLLLTKDAIKTNALISRALQKRTPVLADITVKNNPDENIGELIVKVENNLELADKVTALTKNENDYKKLQEKMNKATDTHSWEEVGRISLGFIDSLR